MKYNNFVINFATPIPFCQLFNQSIHIYSLRLPNELQFTHKYRGQVQLPLALVPPRRAGFGAEKLG